MKMRRFLDTKKSATELTLHSEARRLKIYHCVMGLTLLLVLPILGGAQVPEPKELKPSGARRTITNQDLEPLRQKRLDADAADERQRKQLGLPTREEVRRSQQEQDRRLFQLAQQYLDERREAEALRTQVEDLNAKLAAQYNQPVQTLSPYQSYWPNTYPNYGPVLPTTTTIISDWDPYQRPIFGVRIPYGNRRGYGYEQRYGRYNNRPLIYSMPRPTVNRRR